MNFCTKCASYYQQPGTCNCFAAARPISGPYRPLDRTTGSFETITLLDTVIKSALS